MILLEDDFPAPVSFGQVSFISYLPSKKIYLPLTTRWDFQWVLLSGSMELHIVEIDWGLSF